MKKDTAKIFSMMKDEDRRYGEKAGKSHVVVKDRKQTLKTFKNMKPSDIMMLSEDYEDEFDYDTD